MHRPNLTYYPVRSTNEGNTIQPERRVHDDPGPLICHRTVGCRDRHGEDFSFLFAFFFLLKKKGIMALASIVIPINDVGGTLSKHPENSYGCELLVRMRPPKKKKGKSLNN